MVLYNRLVALRNRYRNAFSQIDVQLRRRHDLIPNLVETARGYLRHEASTLEAVIKARAQAVAASQGSDAHAGEAASMRAVAGAESQLTASLGRLLVVSENYPELKADRSMQSLTEELTSTENRIAFARQAFNDAVTEYNTSREKFPATIVAASFGFAPAELLESPGEEVAAAPRVSFG
jgi:LemA protein